MSGSLFPQYLAALAGSLAGLSLGTMLTWSAPAVPKIQSDGDIFISSDAVSWIGSLMPLGAAASTIPVGFCMDKFGRKWTLICLVIPSIVGWCLLAFPSTVGMYYAGRFLTGISGGAFSIIVPVYIVEISEKRIRGLLTTSFELFLDIGIVLVNVVGYFASVMWLSITCGIVGVVFATVFFFMPESPRHYLKMGKREKAERSMRWLRGKGFNTARELQEIQEGIDLEEKLPRTSLTDMLFKKNIQKGILISFGLMFFQQLGGINAILFYTVDIFEAAGSSLDQNISSIITGCVEVASVFVTFILIDKTGRRILLIVSSTLMAICNMLLGMYFYMNSDGQNIDSIRWLPLLLLTVYIVGFALGFGPIPCTVVSEIFTTNARGKATSATCMFKWLLGFVVSKFYVDINNEFGPQASFWTFGIISCVGVAFVFFLVIETKGKSLEQIQIELTGANG